VAVGIGGSNPDIQYTAYGMLLYYYFLFVTGLVAVGSAHKELK
jgi:hypothetical protein